MNEQDHKILNDIKMLVFDNSQKDSIGGYSFETIPHIWYSINYQGPKNYTLDFIKDTKSIEWFHEKETDETNCEYCGYGKDVYIVGKMNDDNYYYFCYWNGCMTYDRNMRDSGKIYVSNTLDDIFIFCMDENTRVLYTDRYNLSNGSDESDESDDSLENEPCEII